MNYQSYNIEARVVYELKIKVKCNKVRYYFYGLLGLDRRSLVGSELPEYFFVYQFALNKIACSTSLGYF
jgi:hypothetical protein